MEPLSVLLLLLVGTWAALDGTSVAQVMVSRPLISGILAGAVLGDPATGLLVGGLLEALHMADVPAGGVRLPEPGPGAVPAVAAAVFLGDAGGLAAGVGLGVGMSWVGGASMSGLRRVNSRFTQGGAEGGLSPGELAGRHWLCVAGDAVRGLLLTGAGLALALALPAGTSGLWPLSLEGTVVLLAVPAALPAGALLRGWVTHASHVALLLLGLGGGALLAVLLGG